MKNEPTTKTPSTFYLVRAENRGGSESFVYGIYATEAEAEARVSAIEADYDYAWYEEVALPPAWP